MKVLIVGNGGREHAIAWKIKQSPLLSELYVAPGNAGTAAIATNVDVSLSNLGVLALWAVENEIDLTIVGPEAPLADGVVDVFQEHGLRIFGPSKAAAQLEASKVFSKEVMTRAGVATAAAEVFSDVDSAKEYIQAQGAPIVIKADGLAAGKGVLVAQSVDEALQAVEEYLVADRFGDAGKTVLIEECLIGREASVIAIVDESNVIPFVVSQDYKRLQDGDAGPNTGGMGAISPTEVLADKRVENLVGDIFLPVINELRNRGIVYKGFLYAGVMIGEDGIVRVIEFNCRLGDPEAQVLMMRLKSDLLSVINEAVDNNLSSVELQWRSEAAACIVAASRGYPGTVDDGKVIEGLSAIGDAGVVFQAGTKEASDGASHIESQGGRILAVTALGASLNQALQTAYEGIEKISFDGMHYRKDIGGGVW